MGAEGIIERYRQLEPKIFICQTEVVYSGKMLNLKDKVISVHSKLKAHIDGFLVTIITRGPVPDSPNM